MSRIMSEPTYNKYQDVLDELNKVFIAVKISQMDDKDEKVANAKKYHPLPNTNELDSLQNKIIEAFREFEKPVRVWR